MLSSRIVITVTLGSAWMLSAQSQSPAQPPVGVKRVPPAAQGKHRPKTYRRSCSSTTSAVNCGLSKIPAVCLPM